MFLELLRHLIKTRCLAMASGEDMSTRVRTLLSVNLPIHIREGIRIGDTDDIENLADSCWMALPVPF